MSDKPDPSARPAGPGRAGGRSARELSLPIVQPSDANSPLRKPVNTLAIVPKSAKITSLGRKSYNVLLHEAQEQGLDKDVFRAPLERIIRGVDFDSNDQELVKKHLRAMVSTTVEWQSPTTGEGQVWNVSGLLAHAKLSKERGQVWVEWSYAVNLKQELLEPTVFARLSLEVISQLRSHAAIALYEICSRYKEIGRTSRQSWQWWRPVLSGRPETEQTAKLEYRIFKRDTLKPAVAEVCAVTDIDVELVEHKAGRFISELQFLIRPKAQSRLPLRQPPDPVDLGLIGRARSLGIDDAKAEELLSRFGTDALREGLDALQRRIATAFPEPLKDRYRYLKALMPGASAKVEATADAAQAAGPEPQARKTQWVEEWVRRRREAIAKELEGLSVVEQDRLSAALSMDLEARKVHPSIRKRLQTSGWQHAMVVNEMIRFYAQATIGEGWDRPTPDQLLEVAAQMGDTPGR